MTDNVKANSKVPLFDKLLGSWNGTKKLYPEPDKLVNVGDTGCNIVQELNGKFLKIQYHHQIDINTYKGSLLIGFSFEKQQYQASWVDEFHMRDEIMNLKSDRGINLQNSPFTITLNGNYDAGDETWGWIIDINLSDEGELLIQHFNVTPSGEAYLGVDIIYGRVN